MGARVTNRSHICDKDENRVPPPGEVATQRGQSGLCEGWNPISVRRVTEVGVTNRVLTGLQSTGRGCRFSGGCDKVAGTEGSAAVLEPYLDG